MNATTVIENVEFRATSPSTRLHGLENAQRRLDALSASLKQVQGQLAGISSGAIFKLSARQYADRAYTQEGKLGTMSVRQLARRLGFPDTKDVAAVANQVENEIQTAIAKIRKRLDSGLGKKATANAQQKIRELQTKSFFTDASARQFKNPTQAGRFFEQYAKQALANRERGEAALRAILLGTTPNHGPTIPPKPSNLGQAVNQAVKESKAAASVPPEPPLTETPKKATPKKAKTAGVTTTRTFTDESGGLIEERRTTYPGTEVPDKVTQIRRTGKGRTLTTTIQGEMEQRTTRDRIAKRLEKQFNDRMVRLAAEYGRDLSKTSGAAKSAQLRRGVIQQAGAFYRSNPQFAALGFKDRLVDFVHADLPDEAASHRKALDRQQRALMKRRAQAIKQSDDASRKQAEAEIEMLAERKRAYDRFAKAGVDARRQMDKERRKTSTFDTLKQQQSLFNTLSTQAAMEAETDLRKRGARLSKENFDPLTRRRTGATYLLEENGRLNKYRVDYSKEAASMRMVSSQPKRPTDRLSAAVEGLSPRNMLANLVKVSAWSAAVMVLYKSVELAAYAFKRLEETGMEMAHLDVVFRGVGGSAKDLTMDIVQLAAAQGRSTSEAMESATEWARLGGSRAEINEEVRVSAMAANIAQTHLSETTKQLSALMHIYHLEASDLNGTLGMLVNTSLTWNAELDQIFQGLDRSAAAAKVAGVSLAELQGMLGVVMGATGNTGATTGSSLRYIFQSLNRPDIQKQLRGFGIEPLGNNLEQKPAGQIFGELSAIYGTLKPRTQQRLSDVLGGRFNASRVPVLLENYPQVLKLAVDAQLNLNRAQEANVKILDTLKAQLAGVRTEFDRMILEVGSSKLPFLGNRSPMDGAAIGLKFLRNLMSVSAKAAPWLMESMVDAQHPMLAGTKAGQRGITGTILDLMQGANYLFETPAERDENAFDRKLGELRGNKGANARRVQSFDLALAMARNGSMTAENANAFGDILSKMPGGQAPAAHFLTAFQKRDTAGVLETLGQARQQAKQLLLASEKAESEALLKRQTELGKRKESLSTTIATKIKLGQPHAAEDQESASLDRELEKNSQAVDENAAAYEKLEGEINLVAAAQEKYTGLLKTQEEVLERTGKLYTQVPAHTAERELLQQAAAVEAQVEAEKQFQADFAKSPEAQTAEGKTLVESFPDRLRKLEAQQDALNAPENQRLARQYDQQTRGIHAAENAEHSASYGYDEADKLLRARKELTDDIARSEEKLRSVEHGSSAEQELIGRELKDQELLYQNNLDLRRRAADVEREIHQLAMDQNREFSRSFFGSGPAEMLRKLAAFKMVLADGRKGVTTGQLFSMNPGMRQDVGSLTGQNPDMWRLLLEQKKLKGFAQGGYTGPGNPNEIAGVVHKGEYVLSQQDLFNLRHDNLFPQGTRLLPNGGVYRPVGIPLDDVDNIRPQIRIKPPIKLLPKPPILTESPEARSFFAQISGSGGSGRFVRGQALPPGGQFWQGIGRAAGSVGQWGRGALNAAGRLATNPRTWANVGAHAGMGLTGIGVTGGLNWLGGKVNPKLGSSDNYAGAAYGLGTDAAGGAVAGMRAGPIGAAVGAVSGMVIGDAVRYYQVLRDIHRIKDDSWRQQVSAAQSAILRRQSENPRLGSEYEQMMATRRASAARDHQEFEAKMAAIEARSATTDARIKALNQKSVDWLHPDAVSRMNDNVIRVYKMPDGHYAQFWNGETTPHVSEKPKNKVQGFERGGYTGDGPSNQVAGVVHKGEYVIPKDLAVGHQGGNSLTALKNAAVALDLLAEGAHRLNSSFAALASRVDGLFKNRPALQFTPAGQNGGWYPGKSS